MKKQRPKNIFWIVSIFALCAYGFWHNAQKQYSAIVHHELNQIDETQSLSDEDIRYLQRYQKDFKATFEIELIIKIVKDIESVSQPEHPSYLCIVITPETGDAKVYTSTLVRALLGQKVIDTYNNQYLQPQVKADNWELGLKQFISAITGRLTELIGEQTSPQTPPAQSP